MAPLFSFMLSHHLERDYFVTAALGRFGRRRRFFRQCCVHEAAHLICGLELHMVCDMGVRIQREAGAVMPQHAGYRFHVSAGLQSQGRERMSQVMEANPFVDSRRF